MSFLSYSTDYQGVVDVFMRDPDRYFPFAVLLEKIMNGKSELSTPQREMIALYVSKLNGCHYCVGSHRAVLEALNLDEETISAVEKGSTTDPKMRPVFDFSTKLTQNPGAITQADIDVLRGAGWSDQTIEDITGVVSLFSFLNRLVDGFGIKGSAESLAQGAGMVAQHGYGPVAQMLQSKSAA